MNQNLLRAILLLLSGLVVLWAAPGAEAAPPGQAAEIKLRLTNDSDTTICYVFIADPTDADWGDEWLGKDSISPGGSYMVTVSTGHYHVLFLDCDGKVLLHRRGIDLHSDSEVTLTKLDIRNSECDANNDRGWTLDLGGSYAEALAVFQEVVACYREVGDRAGEAAALNNIGLVYSDLRRYPDAMMQFEAAQAIQREIGDRSGEGTTLSNIGAAYLARGQYAEALAQFDAALAIMRALGERSHEAETLNRIGGVYAAQGRNADALEQYEAALAIRGEVGDPHGEAATLVNIGDIYALQGRYAEALDHYETAVAMLRAVGDRASEGTTVNNIAKAYLAQGRYAEALEQFEVAAAIARALGDRGSEGATLNNIGVVYRAQGRYSEALAQYEAALAIWRELGDRAGEGATLTSVGDVYDALGQDDEALDRYEAALVLLRALQDRRAEGTALNNVGKAYRALGRYEEALAQYEAALALLRAEGDRKVEGTTLNNIGGVYRAQGRYPEALAQFEAALAIRREVGDRSGEGTTLNNIGLVYEAQGKFAEAVASYAQAIALFEAVRAEAGSEAARASFIAQWGEVYDQIIRLQLRQDEAADAFLTTERGRARALLDSLATGHIELFDDAAAGLLANETEAYAVRLSAEDALARAKALNPRDPRLVADLEQQLAVAESAYTKARAAIESRRGQLSSLVPGRSNNVLSLRAVQKLLDGETTLVSYWMLGDHAVAFVVTADEFTVVELPDATTDNIAATLENLYQWSNKENPHPRPLRNLYTWLVEPLAEHLQTPHVAIVPHQSLHTVPFAALTAGRRYFGEEHTLTLLPSASALRFLGDNARKGARSGQPTAVILGNPQIDLPDLASLPFAEAEAEAVGSLLGTTVYTGAQASELQLRAVVSGTDILHLAAHGSYDSANPLYSAIALAAGGDQDGLLETHEIFGLPLAGNELVVLSACETNVGQLSRGDEVVGLTRAFFFAGAPAVIASLWNVNDEATQALMVSFYRHWLDNGMSKAGALQAAQADVRDNPRWASPYYWAAFALNGDLGQEQ